jgi:hypothetical protein
MRRRGAANSAGGDDAPAQRHLAWDILSGAFFGVLLAGVLLSVGLLRAVGAVLLGRHIAPLGPGDLRIVEYYVGSFALAGAALGAAKPLLRSRTRTYVGFALAGAVIGIAITVTLAQGDTAPPPLVGLVIGVVVGAASGCAFARGLLRVRD